MTSEADLVEAGLKASAFIFQETKKRLRAKDEQVKLEDLRLVKKAALDMNTSFTRYVKHSRAQLDRLLLELHLMRQATDRDRIDRDANRARIFELLRQYRAEDHVAGSAGGGGDLSLAPLQPQPINQQPSATLTSAPSGAHAVDRAIGAVARLDASIAQLSPIGTTHLHGAGILAGLRGSKYESSVVSVASVASGPPPPPSA